MRTANYRDDVLWPIAYKMGLDPALEFLTDEGKSLDSYINAGVRRAWDATDFPEWTTIQEFAPDANHQIPWEAVPVGGSTPVVLSRPLKVYLVDPRVAPYPIDTRFRQWDEGLHVGFDHGATVWIKYLPPAPRFTSTPGDLNATYGEGALVYSPASGQCFKSLINGNTGNDPSPSALGTTVNLQAEVLTRFLPGSAATAALSEKWSVQVDLLGFYAQANQLYSLTLLDVTGASHTFSYTTAVAGGTVDDVLTGLLAAAAASGDTWLTALTLSKEATTARLFAELLTAPFSISAATVTSVDSVVTSTDPGHVGETVTGDDGLVVTVGAPATVYALVKTHIQQYAAAQPARPATAQATQIYLTPAGGVVPGSTWKFTLIDTAGVEHVAIYEALPSDGQTEIINGIIASFNPTPPDDLFLTLVVTANYDLRFITIFSPAYVTVQAEVTSPIELSKWELVKFPLALVEPVVDGAYADALREAGQTDKAMAEQQNSTADFADRVTKALPPGYTDLTDARAPAPRYRGKLPAQGAPK
jgi:hypothetical protein